jgi:hypothetical protein
MGMNRIAFEVIASGIALCCLNLVVSAGPDANQVTETGLVVLDTNIPDPNAADYTTLTRAIVTPPPAEIAKKERLDSQISDFTGHEGHVFLRVSGGYCAIKGLSVWDKDKGWQNAVLSFEGAGFMGEIYFMESVQGQEHAKLKQGMSAFFWPGAEFVIFGEVEFVGLRFKSSSDFPVSIKLRKKGAVVISGEGSAENLKTKNVMTFKRKPFNEYIKELGSPDQLVREGAAESLGRLAKSASDKQRALEALKIALSDKAMEVRRNAAESIGMLGISEGEASLKKLLDASDEDRWVKEVAGEALAKR